jgi:hypothetical protein
MLPSTSWRGQRKVASLSRSVNDLIVSGAGIQAGRAHFDAITAIAILMDMPQRRRRAL